MTVRYEAARLRALVNDLPGRADALADAIAGRVRDGAKGRAPVRTGALRDSIDVETNGPGKRTVFAGVDYGLFVEMGTYKMAAQPFLVPAVQDVSHEVDALAKGLFG